MKTGRKLWNTLLIFSNDITEKACTKSKASSYLQQLQRLGTAFFPTLFRDLLTGFNSLVKNCNLLKLGRIKYMCHCSNKFVDWENRALAKS